MAKTIEIPYHFEPRLYQKKLWNAMDKFRFAFILWCRRSGKDKTCLNIMIKKMVETKGVYYYVFPTFQQGRKALWDNIGKDGFKFIDHFPKELVKRKGDKQMFIELKNGSIFQIVGGDSYNTLVGTNPRGVVFSEYALQDPLVWVYFRPILMENKGWVIFNTTPRGQNHAYKDWLSATKNPLWFTQKLTVEDTQILTPDEIEVEKEESFKREGDNSFFLQEWYCDFNAPVKGTFYAHIIERLEKNGAFKQGLYDARYPVSTFWDLGFNDSTSIWFAQTVGNQIRIIDFYQDAGKGMPVYISAVKNKSYVYEKHFAPHDIEVHEYGSGRSRIEIARSLGINFEKVQRLSLEDGIQATRVILEQCLFDADKCEYGLNCLRSYQKKWNEKNSVYENSPVHNWASHAADAMRYLAVAIKTEMEYTDLDGTLNDARTNNLSPSDEPW